MDKSTKGQWKSGLASKNQPKLPTLFLTFGSNAILPGPFGKNGITWVSLRTPGGPEKLAG